MLTSASLLCYLLINGIHVDIGFLGPLLPELGVVESNVRAVLRRDEAGFGERRPFAFALNSDGGGSPLQDLVDVFFTESTAFVVFIHDGGVSSFPQKVLDFLLGELLELS